MTKQDLFVICYDAEINWFEGAEEDFEYPYKDYGVLGVCTTAEKTKEHISRYARELSNMLTKQGIVHSVNDTNDGWHIQVEAKIWVPLPDGDAEKINFFSFYCINFEPDQYEGLNTDDNE